MQAAEAIVFHLRYNGGEHEVDLVLVTTGTTAYMRRVGIAVAPLALFGA